MFWKKSLILRSVNEAFNCGNVSLIQTQGILTCFRMGDKLRLYIHNWRPITLLNIIYKIASGVIAIILK